MLRAIFIRKGSIGEKTTLINDPNQDLLDTQRAILNFGEIAIVCCTQAESSWTLLTDSRLIVASENNIVALDYENITLVSLMPVGILPKRKDKISQIFIENNQGETFMLDLEAGRPIFGIYQILHYIVGR